MVGRTIVLNGQPVVVIGVAPRDFGFFLKTGSLVGKPPDIWLPFSFSAKSREPRGRYMSAFARLRDGVTLAQARVPDAGSGGEPHRRAAAFRHRTGPFG